MAPCHTVLRFSPLYLYLFQCTFAALLSCMHPSLSICVTYLFVYQSISRRSLSRTSLFALQAFINLRHQLFGKISSSLIMDSNYSAMQASNPMLGDVLRRVWQLLHQTRNSNNSSSNNNSNSSRSSSNSEQAAFLQSIIESLKRERDAEAHEALYPHGSGHIHYQKEKYTNGIVLLYISLLR